MNENYFLVYDSPPDSDFTEGKVVSLSPWASYSLNRRRIPYVLLEDFYSEKELRMNQDHYLLEQIRWVDRLDDFLKEEIPYCRENNLGLIRIYFSRFKFLTDTLVIRSLILDQFIKTERPKSIMWVAEKEGVQEKRSFYYGIKDRAPSIFRELVQSACQKHQIPFRIIEISPSQAVSPFLPVSVSRACLRGLLRRLKIKPFYQFFTFRKWEKWAGASRSYRDLKILFLDAGSPAVDLLIRNFIRKGSAVYLQNKNSIVLANLFFEQIVLNVAPPASYSLSLEEVAEDCCSASEKLFQKGALMNWLSEKCPFEVISVLRPLMEDFIKKECPSLIVFLDRLVRFYRNEGIDFVIARGIGQYSSVALTAAKMAGVQRVCFQHACSALDQKDGLIDNLDLFDYFFATDSESEDYFRSAACQEYLNSCAVFQSPHYLRDVMGEYRKRKPFLPIRDRRQRILFLPKKFSGNLVRFNTTIYSLPWYFEFLKKIIELFEERQDCLFIYKHFPYNQEWAEQSILRYLRDKKVPNIIIDDKPFHHYAGRVDKVLLDYPATGLYEAAAAGIPVMSLCLDIFEKRDSAFRMFGRSIQEFSRVSEASEKINQFLNAPPENYLVHLNFGDSDATEIIAGLRQKRIEEVLK